MTLSTHHRDRTDKIVAIFGLEFSNSACLMIVMIWRYIDFEIEWIFLNAADFLWNTYTKLVVFSASLSATSSFL